MRIVPSIYDDMHGYVTYQLSGGRRARFSRIDLERYGASELLRNMGEEIPSAPVPVMQNGRIIGTLPADFDPIFIKSNSFLYDPRSGDFVLEGNVWVASPTLGPGDLDAVSGFVRASDTRSLDTSKGE